MVASARKPATFEDLLAREDPDRLEVIGGEIVEKAMPSPVHSYTEIKLGVAVDPFNRKPGTRGPGGCAWACCLVTKKMMMSELDASRDHRGSWSQSSVRRHLEAPACRSATLIPRSNGQTA